MEHLGSCRRDTLDLGGRARGSVAMSLHIRDHTALAAGATSLMRITVGSLLGLMGEPI